MRQEIWFQKYRIIKLLGRGGTSKVYLAEHIRLKSYRAIKCINKSHPLYDSQLKEAQILKNLKHSCIPTIYDIEEDENSSYIIEQYLEGETLKSFINAKGKLDFNIIIHFATQLCDLIQYLHNIERPILYLDLKPDNIIVTGKTLKLVDFGSAIYQDEADTLKDYYGTKGYAAPEMYRHGKLDERCDVFGIGMLMYFMVTGKPVDANNIRIQPIDFDYDCPKHLKKIINRCLKYNPSQRYASVNQLNKQLSAYRKYKLNLPEPGSSIRFAVAGAQPRIGVTHLSFRLCRYFIHNNMSCLYHEKNNSGDLRKIVKRYEGIICREGIYDFMGIPMISKEPLDSLNTTGYRVFVEDFGCLTENNLNEFMKADIKLLILGAKEWELTYAEQVLKMVTEYKDIIYLFNYLDGRQFQKVMKSMDRRNCFRLPYEPDPFAQHMQEENVELFTELTRRYLV